MPTKPKRKSYDDKFRASAVIMLEAAGYPEQKGALTRTAQYIGVPHPTLSRWYNAQRNPPPDELVQEKRLELIDMVKSELAAIFKAMPTVRGDASYRDLGTVAGILADKQQLLDGKATERIEHDHTGLTHESRVARIADLLERGRDRGTRQPDRGELVQ